MWNFITKFIFGIIFQNSTGSILGMVCLIDVKQNGSASVGYLKFRNGLILGTEGPIIMDQKGWELISHDHDRDLSVTMTGWM